MRTTSVILVGLFGVAVSLVGTTPTLLSTHGGQAPVAPALLGPVPHTCPAGPPAIAVDASFGSIIGARPVGVSGFAAGPTLNVGVSTHDLHGWARKVLWVTWPRYTGVVTLSGYDLHRGTPLWFQISDGPVSRTPHLNPRHPVVPGTGPTGTGFAQFPSYLYIPVAGCYVLRVHWPGGSWQRTFAAGF